MSWTTLPHTKVATTSEYIINRFKGRFQYTNVHKYISVQYAQSLSLTYTVHAKLYIVGEKD